MSSVVVVVVVAAFIFISPPQQKRVADGRLALFGTLHWPGWWCAEECVSE